MGRPHSHDRNVLLSRPAGEIQLVSSCSPDAQPSRLPRQKRHDCSAVLSPHRQGRMASSLEFDVRSLFFSHGRGQKRLSLVSLETKSVSNMSSAHRIEVWRLQRGRKGLSLVIIDTKSVSSMSSAHIGPKTDVFFLSGKRTKTAIAGDF